jgi:diketogulonate reductase-like aldo/keto reductase
LGGYDLGIKMDGVGVKDIYQSILKPDPCNKRHDGPTDNISRRDFLGMMIAAGAVGIGSGTAMAETMMQRPIPRTGESLPMIGMGTWQTFDVGPTNGERGPLRQVLAEFAKLGGTVVDSSPMYGRSESVVGDLAAELNAHKKLFLATKVWTSGKEAGIRQMEQSLAKLRASRIDLMQVHNLLDYRTHLATLRRWKEQGRVRYIGVTHYTESAYDDLAKVIRSEELDFVQLNYSVAERIAEHRLLPVAAELGLAVLINRPFAAGGLFRKVSSHPLPSWAAEIDCTSWAQLFLKFVISHPAVTCAIPATSKVQHLRDNMRAGLGRLPDAKMRERIARSVAET